MQLSGSNSDLSIAHLLYYTACDLGNYLKANINSHLPFIYRQNSVLPVANKDTLLKFKQFYFNILYYIFKYS